MRGDETQIPFSGLAAAKRPTLNGFARRHVILGRALNSGVCHIARYSFATGTFKVKRRL
jgi:hypothetical protein